MKYLLTGSILLFLAQSILSQSLNIRGYLASQEDGSPIAYASIVEESTNKYGTTSDTDGTFELKLPEGFENKSVFISSLGFQDTLISVKSLLKDGNVLLKPITITLEGITVYASKTEEATLGTPNSKHAQREGRDLSFQSSAGVSWGAYFDVRKKERGLLNTLHVYIAEKGFPEAPFALRFLKFKGKFEFFKQQPLTDFEDLTSETIILKANNSGWFEVNLSDYNISIPDNGIYILFTPLDKGTQYSYETPFGKWYGASLGWYANPAEAKRVYSLFIRGAKLAVFKNNDGLMPGVALSYDRIIK